MGLSIALMIKHHVSYDGGKTLKEKKENVYYVNITHNLGDMAKEAGIYEALWRPYMLKESYVPIEDYHEELKYEDSVEVRAYEIIPIIEKGLEDMKARPEHYKTFDSPNGWGTYVHFVPFIEEYLSACKEFPQAIVSVSR
jgi:hypothetical protein